MSFDWRDGTRYRVTVERARLGNCHATPAGVQVYAIVPRPRQSIRSGGVVLDEVTSMTSGWPGCVF